MGCLVPPVSLWSRIPCHALRLIFGPPRRPARGIGRRFQRASANGATAIGESHRLSAHTPCRQPGRRHGAGRECRPSAQPSGRKPAWLANQPICRPRFGAVVLAVAAPPGALPLRRSPAHGAESPRGRRRPGTQRQRVQSCEHAVCQQSSWPAVQSAPKAWG